MVYLCLYQKIALGKVIETMKAKRPVAFAKKSKKIENGKNFIIFFFFFFRHVAKSDTIE